MPESNWNWRSNYLRFMYLISENKKHRFFGNLQSERPILLL